MSCSCKDYKGDPKNIYYSHEEALKNKQWSEQQFHISLRIYQCDKGYWHLTSENT